MATARTELPWEPARALEALGITGRVSSEQLDTLPFSAGDTTAGSESELQVVVEGSRRCVDLPLSLESSNYIRNIRRRAAAGDNSPGLVTRVEQYLSGATDDVWENSWVRLPRRALSRWADEIVTHDLLSDKTDLQSPPRTDRSRFLFSQSGEEWLRVPVSYLLKLALADVVSTEPLPPPDVRKLGERLLEHYLNDNSSPETHSFHVVSLAPETGMGRAIARETSKRFLLTQLLVLYANKRFGLEATGQRSVVYFAPHPPIRQKQLSGLISDAFYRELFVNPCLSGWDRGEDKFRYMILCHQVLSRSQLHAVIKLREAGLVTRSLVTLPSASNISLANNGTHLSLGSRRLTQRLADPTSGFGPADEKRLADLVIKIVEHFLPLFVGTYSAAPYRLDFGDFRPETALGFLPHELDFTHLRMLWRRWKKKAGLTVLGQPLTPVGLRWLDRGLSTLFRLRGDFIPDYRLIDYLVAPLSTDQSPGLDGRLGNDRRLKRDLAQLGVFDESMSTYLLYKPRAQATMGFSGFEGRHYSVFESLLDDLGDAASLQVLLTALAYKYIASGEVSHVDVPDDPEIESERRQIFFGAAVGIPTFFVRRESRNRFLRKILGRTSHLRMSRRYPGYVRVQHLEYRRALVTLLREDAVELADAMRLDDVVARLVDRLEDAGRHSVTGKLTRGILSQAGVASPMDLSGDEFNRASETFYRTTLRRRHLREGFELLVEDIRRLNLGDRARATAILGEGDLAARVAALQPELLEERVGGESLRRLIQLTLVTIGADIRQAAGSA
jgi:hypothetical protein